MATRKPSSRKATNPPVPDDVLEPVAEPAEAASGEASVRESAAEALEAIAESIEQSEEFHETEGTVPPTEELATETALKPVETETDEHQPRFHFFLIDAGWKSSSAKVIRDNFHMVREFQNSDPLYVLTREQSIEVIRANPDLIGRDPVILVHDLQAKGGQGESGYHGFRLCLGLIKNSAKALEALQEFLRFVHSHRRSADIERDIRKKLHHAGLEGALEVIREGAGELME